MKELWIGIKRKCFLLHRPDIWEISSKNVKPLQPILVLLSEESLLCSFRFIDLTERTRSRCWSTWLLSPTAPAGISNCRASEHREILNQHLSEQRTENLKSYWETDLIHCFIYGAINFWRRPSFVLHVILKIYLFVCLFVCLFSAGWVSEHSNSQGSHSSPRASEGWLFHQYNDSL